MAPASPVLVALAFALGAPPAAAQVPGVELPAEAVEAQIPQNSAVSEQYQAIEEEITQAVAEPPAPPAPAPEPAMPTPDPPPPPAVSEQYHSETPDVSVRQDQPSNVNVSIRINSPGDNGPVVQVNHAGGGTTVEQVVEQRPSAPPTPQPPRSTPADDSGELPDTWHWEWTSACFGGAARAAAAVPNWSWRWSCDDGASPSLPGERVADILPGMPDAGALVEQVLASTPVAVPVVAPSASTGARDERAGGASSPAARRAPAAVAAAPARGSPLGAAPLLTATAAVPAAVAQRVREVVRAAPEARPAPAPQPGELPIPLGGPTAISTNALGAAVTALLGLWLAVLTTALVLVIPRLRRRRRSGPARRLTRGTSSRLERPG